MPRTAKTRAKAPVAPAPEPPAAPPQAAPCDGGPAEPGVPVHMPEGFWKWLAWGFSLIPVVGLVLGLLFAGSAQPRARRFGRVCLALAVVGLLAVGVHSWMKDARLLDGGDEEVQVLE